MTHIEIMKATQAELKRRLAEIEDRCWSPIGAAEIFEPDLIRRELARRVGCAS